jgi:hypothetical protein
MTEKWFPQDDILAHPNVKLFISHGGLGSVVEAKFHGVPILGVPFFADQSGNVRKIVDEGWGILLNPKNLTEQSLEKSINAVLHDSRYNENARKLSVLFRDRPLMPKQLAIFWIEYVIRHRGASHMHFQGADLNMIQKTSLDVIGFLLVVGYLIILSLRLFAKQLVKIVRKCRKMKID